MTKSKKQHEPRKKSQPRQQTMKKPNEYLQNPDEEMESLVQHGGNNSPPKISRLSPLSPLSSLSPFCSDVVTNFCRPALGWISSESIQAESLNDAEEKLRAITDGY